MPVFRWGQAWSTFHDIEREMDRLLQNVNIVFEGLRPGRQYPAINLYEMENEYLLTAELPGTKGTELELSVASGVLTMKGVRRVESTVPEEMYRRRERKTGQWERTIALPDRVEEESMSAEFNEGILRLHLPKAAETDPRQIPVVDGNG